MKSAVKPRFIYNLEKISYTYLNSTVSMTILTYNVTNNAYIQHQLVYSYSILNYKSY